MENLMLEWLQSTSVSTWIREADSLWAFPGILTFHTLGLGVLVGAAAVVDLRLLGVGGRMPLTSMRPLFHAMWFGFLLNAVTGTLLFAADAERRGTSAFFLMKLGFVAVGVATIALIQRDLYAPAADPLVPKAAARRLALVSLVVWTAAITAGRLLAYI
jgi:hypothetical protein